MKILITGSAGLVGSACVELFDTKGWQVVGIDNDSRHKFFGTPEKTGYGLTVDITDKDAVNYLFEVSGPFDAIIHAAGQPSHDWATDHALEDFDVNARGTLILLEATRKYCPNATFVYVSTDKVYGENMRCSLRENETRYSRTYHFIENEIEKISDIKNGFDESLGLDFAGDRSLFGCSKAAADMYVQCYGAKFGMNTACFRPGCITGKNHAGAEQHGFLAYLAKCIKEGKTYKIHGNGKQVRDQIHARDLAECFYSFIERPVAGAVYNMGGGPERAVSVLDAITLLEEAVDRKANVIYGEERKGDRRWDVHDISKFRKDYPEWDYQYSLADIIKDLV